MPLTGDLQYQYTDAGIVLNADPPGDFVDIERVTGLDNSPFRVTDSEREGSDGGFTDAEFEKSRQISLQGTVYSTPSAVYDFLDLLKYNFAPTKAPQPFYFTLPGGRQRVVFAKSLGCNYDWEAAMRTGTTPVKFNLVAEDPRIYDSQLQIANVPFGSTIVTGLGFPLGFSIGFGGTTGIGDGRVVTNAGNRDTPAILTISGGVVTDPVIINDANGGILPFSITLAASDALAIDLLNKTVVLNGTANRRGSLINPQWFMLEPDDNFIRYRASSGGSGSQLTVAYRNARR